MSSSGNTRIHIKLEDERVEVIELYPGCTADDVRSLLLSLCTDSNRNVQSLVLRKADGALVPVSPGLPSNSAQEPYQLLLRPVATKADALLPHSAGHSALVDAKLTEIAHTLEPLKELRSFKDALVSFEKRLEATEKSMVMSFYPGSTTKVPGKTVKRITQVDPVFASQPKYVLTEETVAYLKLPSFNNWQWEENEMASLMEHMFIELGLVEEYKIEIPTLRRFLLTVKENYKQNPFHNFRHCFCVTQMMYGILHSTGLVNKLDPIDKLILIVSCIMHDIDHPGFNNAYQINAKTELAIIYNDVSPLENHHCAVGFTILKNSECNILQNVSPRDWSNVRKGIIRCILATDMAKHGEIVNKFKSIFDTFNLNDPDHRAQLLVMLVKCADISNEARPTNVAEIWLDCLLEEFFTQSDREKAEGLPVAPFMDREKVTKAKAQVDFLGFVMIPLFETLAKVVPELEESILPQIRKSRAYYLDLQQQEIAQVKQVGVATVVTGQTNGTAKAVAT